MRKEHYNVSLEVPCKDGVVEVRHFRIIADDRMATGRHDVHKGSFVMTESGQWFLLDHEAQIFEHDSGIIRNVIRTQRRARSMETTGEYDGSASVLDPNSPYAQAFIKALYFFGEYTDAVRRKMLMTCSDRWIASVAAREKAQEIENLEYLILRGALTTKQLRSMAARLDREAKERAKAAESQPEISLL